MLRFSKKADYALIALKDLASSPQGTSSSAREIAERYDVPAELMAKGLQRLAKMGVVASHHGKGGGYHLARASTQISIADIIQAIDGPVLVTACSEEDETCEQYTKCNVRDPLWRLKDRIVQSLTSFTVDELVGNSADNAGSKHAPEKPSLTVTRRPVESVLLSRTTVDQ